MKSKKFKSSLIVILVIFSFIIILISPLFSIAKIEISGNNQLTEEYIKENTGLKDGKNIFAFNSRQAEKQLKENTYIKDININKNFLSRTISIDVEERKLSGYVEYTDGNYLYVDEDGVVLEISKSFNRKLPVIVGLDIKTFSLGQPLQVGDSKSLENMVVLSHLFNKYEMSEDVIRVDLNDSENTHLYINNIDVSIGSIEDIDKKIRTVEAAIATLDKEAKGFLNAENVNEHPVFRILT